jgi:multiple sugar transport system ATP-binding protein
MSVRDNLGFALKMRKTDKQSITKRVDQVASLLGIEQLLARRPAQLSGGQRQRVALGRALVRNASVFLMDEPLSNLDALLRVNTRTEIKRLQRELGTTTIFVTHDQEEAMVLSDRIAILRDGELQQYAPPDETYRAPANTFVAGFIGNPRMNFLTGSVIRSNGSIGFESASALFPLSGPYAERVAASNGAHVTLGIRPEHVELGSPEAGGVTATVDLVELVGPVTYLDLSIGERSLRASVSGKQRFHTGQHLGIRFEPESLHFFERSTGNRIPDPQAQ